MRVTLQPVHRNSHVSRGRFTLIVVRATVTECSGIQVCSHQGRLLSQHVNVTRRINVLILNIRERTTDQIVAYDECRDSRGVLITEIEFGYDLRFWRCNPVIAILVIDQAQIGRRIDHLGDRIHPIGTQIDHHIRIILIIRIGDADAIAGAQFYFACLIGVVGIGGIANDLVNDPHPVIGDRGTTGHQINIAVQRRIVFGADFDLIGRYIRC